MGTNAAQKYSNRMRKQVIERINCLTPTEHEEIFAIIQRQAPDVIFTRNSNGVFFNFALLPDDIIHAIDAFVGFCIENKRELDEYDKRLNECKLGMEAHACVSSGESDIEDNTHKPVAQDKKAVGVDVSDVAHDEKEKADNTDGAAVNQDVKRGKVVAGGARGNATLLRDEVSAGWAQLLDHQTRVDPGFQRYISGLYNDKHAKRKPNTRFYTAKKKYSKRLTQTEKREADIGDVLVPEPFGTIM